jgi:Zn-finger nucleic acid-binding protein
MKCPKCAASMEPVTVGDDEVDRCAGCGGMWFDNLEYEHVAASPAAVDRVDPAGQPQHPELNTKRDVACPRCNQRMIRMSTPVQTHIQFERCGVCHGSFFDAGEIRDLAHLSFGERVSSFLSNFRRK